MGWWLFSFRRGDGFGTFETSTQREVEIGPLGQLLALHAQQRQAGGMHVELLLLHGTKIAAASSSDGVGQVRAYKADDGAVLWQVDVPEGGMYAVDFSPDGNTLASASDDQTVILWDVASRKPLGEPFVAGPGRWMGAKVGLVCVGEDGYADFDSFEVE